MPSKAKSGSKGQDKYKYTELAKVSGTSLEQSNFYGVIVDASFPYKKTITRESTGVSDQMFICTMKIIDPSQFTQAKGFQYSQLVIYATKLEDLPFVHRLGDVIRVHRADLKFHNSKRQFNVNMLYKGSWALYSSEKLSPLGQTTSDAPYAFSGHRVTSERQDSSILATLKNWTNATFKSVDVCAKVDTKTVKLSDASKKTGEDFDVVAKIVQVFELDDYTNELKLRDLSGATVYVLALKVKFPHLKAGAVIKVRSATYDTTCTSDKKVLILQHYSNIMTFVTSSKKASEISSKVSDDKSNENKALKAPVAMTPVVLTEVAAKHAGLPVTSLHDLFHSPESSTTTFRTCFYVTKVEPGTVAEACKSYDKKSKKATSAKGAKGGDLIYQVQFLAKDVSTQFNTNVYRILLYTHEGLGSNFFAQKAANLHSSKDACKKVEAAFGQLTKFNSWFDCVVEKRNGYYFIKDTKMIY